MMTDANVAYASPSSVYRILKSRKMLALQERKNSRKGKGFHQPKAPHKHWHIDFSYFKIGSVFYYFIAVLDGYSRCILAWDLREQMTEIDAEIVVQRAKERFPHAKPRIISDRGQQFQAHDFKRFVAEIEASHVMTSPYYPQSNGKLERFHRTLKQYAYQRLPLDLEDAKRIIGEMIDYYNNERLHSAIDYVTPRQCLEGRRERIVTERRIKHRQAAAQRRKHWQDQNQDLAEPQPSGMMPGHGEAEEARAEERASKECPCGAKREGRKPAPQPAGSPELPALQTPSTCL